MTTIAEIEQFANESGNNFHCRVVNALRERSCLLSVSPYYVDAATDKPREIDLIVERHQQYEDRFSQKYGVLISKFFVECKYIAQPTVFWMSAKDTQSAYEWVVRNTPLQKDSHFTLQHHFIADCDKVAKLFATKNKPAVENEPMYKALNQCLSALVYLRGASSLDRDVENGRNTRLALVEAPLVVVNSFDEFYQVDMDAPGAPSLITKNFQIEVNYAYVDRSGNRRTEYFLIDIVSLPNLDEYFEKIDRNMDAIARTIR